jgi:hypothetical protein
LIAWTQVGVWLSVTVVTNLCLPTRRVSFVAGSIVTPTVVTYIRPVGPSSFVPAGSSNGRPFGDSSLISITPAACFTLFARTS